MIQKQKLVQPAEVLEKFLHNLDSLNASVYPVMLMLGEVLKNQDKKLRDFLTEHGKLEAAEKAHETYALPRKFANEHRQLARKVDQFLTSSALVPRNFLVSFVSEYDSFLGSLIKCFHFKKPELLNGVEKQIAFNELMSFKTIDEAKEYVLEKEVEAVLRKSHADHFEILERKFNIKLRKDLVCWPTFIEMMERRNLFVHCDGIVSSQYISVCSEHQVKFDASPTIGDQLDVAPDYLAASHQTLREIAIKLTHVLWRKVFPDEREQADEALLSLAYELILRGAYPLAITILEFAIALPHHFSDNYKRMFYINLAQSYKSSGESKKCTELIKRLDWSSVGYKFKLAVAVLEEDYEAADMYMAKAAKTDEVTELNFLEWPLFSQYRETAGFKKAFKARYKKDPPEQSSATIASSPLDKTSTAPKKTASNSLPKKAVRITSSRAGSQNRAQKLKPK